MRSKGSGSSGCSVYFLLLCGNESPIFVSLVAVTRDPFRMVPAEEFESYVADMKKNDNFGFDKQFKV